MLLKNCIKKNEMPNFKSPKLACERCVIMKHSHTQELPIKMETPVVLMIFSVSR